MFRNEVRGCFAMGSEVVSKWSLRVSRNEIWGFFEMNSKVVWTWSASLSQYEVRGCPETNTSKWEPRMSCIEVSRRFVCIFERMNSVDPSSVKHGALHRVSNMALHRVWNMALHSMKHGALHRVRSTARFIGMKQDALYSHKLRCDSFWTMPYIYIYI